MSSTENRIIVLTPFAKADQLAAACVLAGIDGVIVPVGDFNAVSVTEPDLARAKDQAAAISKMAGRMDVLLLIRESGQIDASQWRYGKHEADVPAGLALAKMPDPLEGLLLGTVESTEVAGHRTTSSMTKLQASAVTMTPERAAIAKTALMWLLVALVALIVLVIAAIAAMGGKPVVWLGAVVAALVLGFSLWRIGKLLGWKKEASA